MTIAESIELGGELIALIIQGQDYPAQTTFYTPDMLNVQVGHVVYPRDGEVAPHRHRPLERHLVGTSEVLVVVKGEVEVTLYDDESRKIAVRELRQGDVLVLTGKGAHGFRMLEDTVLLEVKQGPYTGLDEKEYLAL